MDTTRRPGLTGAIWGTILSAIINTLAILGQHFGIV